MLVISSLCIRRSRGSTDRAVADALRSCRHLLDTLVEASAARQLRDCYSTRARRLAARRGRRGMPQTWRTHMHGTPLRDCGGREKPHIRHPRQLAKRKKKCARTGTPHALSWLAPLRRARSLIAGRRFAPSRLASAHALIAYARHQHARACPERESISTSVSLRHRLARLLRESSLPDQIVGGEARRRP